MFEQLDYTHSSIPSLTSDYWKEPARELWEELQWYRDARSELEQIIWPACARAYLCKRDLPRAAGMAWIDNSDLGETDIKDGVDFLADSMTLALMPRDESWMTLISKDENEQGVLNDVRDLLAEMHRKSDTRGAYAKHIKQCAIYGTSALGWSWRRQTKMTRFGPAQTLQKLIERGDQLAENEDITKTYRSYRFQVPSVNRPFIRVVDMYDFWLDPSSDLSAQSEAGMITRIFMSISDLKASKNEDGSDKFSNLEGIEPQTLEQIYGNDSERYELVQELGINPLGQVSKNAKFVPVYIFHKYVRQFECNGDQYIDTYFYLAETNNKEGFQVIGVFENPSDGGSRSFFVDTYSEFGNSPYGIGAVEKSLPAYTEKNVIAALRLNASVASVFPAYSVLGGVLQDDGKLRLAPGSINVLQWKSGIGLNYIAPVPVPTGGVQLGEQVEQFLSQKILTQLQAYGAIMQAPNKTVEQSKTATQINTESTTGSITRDNLLEKMSTRTLEPLCQAILEAAQQYLDPEDLSFSKITDGNVSQGSITPDDLAKDLQVICVGAHGNLNKAQEIAEMKDALGVLTTGNALQVLPTGVPILQELLFRLLGRLGVKNLDQYRQDPMQLLLQSPVGQQALQQAQQQGVAQGASAMFDKLHGVPPQAPGQPPAAGTNTPPINSQGQLGAGPMQSPQTAAMQG